MRFTKLAAVAAAAVALTLTLSGCGPAFIRVEEPTIVRTKSFPIDDAKKLDAEVRMDVGEMTLRGGATGVMDGKFESGSESWIPDVAYGVDGSGIGKLRIEHMERDRRSLRSARNVWDVRLNDSRPLTLRVDTGVGTSRLDLGGLNLQRLDVSGGVGETIVDLGSVARNDMNVDIDGGVGRIVLRVPREAAVRVTGYQDGIGDFSAVGFDRNRDNEMFNASYGVPGAKRYDVRINRGVGEVVIEQR